MPSIQSVNPVLRAVGVISAVAILVSGVTFAALQSQVTLTDNTISTAGASGLLVDGTDPDDLGSQSEKGFTFSQLVPGGGYSDPQQFSLINSENGPDMTVVVNATAASTSAPVDKSKVWVKFTLADKTSGEPQALVEDDDSVAVTLAQLETSFTDLPGADGEDRLDANETLTYDVQVKIGADAVSAPEVTIDNFDLVFTGTVVDDDDDDETPTVVEEPVDSVTE